jgi:hypothetical protein
MRKESFGGGASVVGKPTSCRMSLTALGPNPRTAATFSDGSTKNAIIHLHDVHRIGKNGPLPPVEQEAQRIRLAFGNSLPRVSFNVDVFQELLSRWMALCDVPFVAVEHDCFRLLLSYLAACVCRLTRTPRELPLTVVHRSPTTAQFPPIFPSRAILFAHG